MGTYTETFKLKYSDVGTNNELTLKALIGLLQEIAGDHSSSVGYGLNDINTTHVTWILLNWKVTLFSRPHYEEELTITTWPRTFEKLYSYRDFKVYDSHQNLVAIASSKWILINVATKKVEKITPEIANAFGIEKESVFTESFDEKPSVPQDLTLNFSYTIQRRDLDTNGHVNNLHYIDFAFETLPDEIYYSKVFNKMEIHYKKEIKYGETIHCYYTLKDDRSIITIKGEHDIVHAIIQLY